MVIPKNGIPNNMTVPKNGYPEKWYYQNMNTSKYDDFKMVTPKITLCRNTAWPKKGENGFFETGINIA